MENESPGSEDKDAQLMVRAGAGDLAAFQELVIRNQPAAWALAWRYLGDAAEAEDIVQEAFLRLLQAAPRYKPMASFRTYLARIIVRLCLDFRSKKRPLYGALPPEVAGNYETTPEDFLEQKEIAGRLRQALEGLPSAQRMAILLRHLEGFTYSQIAEAMGISAKAVDSLLQRARQTLRARLVAS